MQPELLPWLLCIAWLLPLVSFGIIVLIGPRMGKHGILSSYVATGAILGSFALSLLALVIWVASFGIWGAEAHASAHGGETTVAATEHLSKSASPHETGHAPPRHFNGDWYSLGQFGNLRLSIGYYIDALTIAMFAMVTFIASCIHFYSYGYMHEELHNLVDHEVTLSDGKHLERHGRFHRFFQYLSLFCFSMLGVVISGNIGMVFVFWELVGICSYFLIGFYYERKSASNAANKAFIVNRVGDFGMIVGLAVLWATLGTFNFGDEVRTVTGADGVATTEVEQLGLFSLVRPPESGYELRVPYGMVRAAARPEIEHGVEPSESQLEIWRRQGFGYGLLVVAGLGIFCGCVGKSAQFPLHVWLPDAMEGPTPVSALVHSATMVAAGVYLVARFYPVFTPEVLLTIACIGGITLLLAASIALVATDIKRVLAYSTVSQLGYMMLALGVGGWAAGVFHLITHAFFKSLLFMCSGSVIHATHTNEMPRLGGLRHKMPWTAYTMLVGCLAIIGAGIPFVIGLSGYYSKDSIIAQAMSFAQLNRTDGAVLFAVAAGGAALTAFYMFRLWFMTFAGKPRDHHIYDHAHESPPVMYVPLVVLAVMATIVGWPILGLTGLLEQARPAGEVGTGVLAANLVYPSEHLSHLPAIHTAIHTAATLTAFGTAAAGFLVALLFYGLRKINSNDVRNQFSGMYWFLRNKWYFDELYDFIFVRPVHVVARMVSSFDKQWIDGLINNLARWARMVARFDDAIDRYFIDGFVNLFADWTYELAYSLRRMQTGKLRQYVMLIVVATVVLAMVIEWNAMRNVEPPPPAAIQAGP